MTTARPIYLALTVLALLGGALYFTQRGEQKTVERNLAAQSAAIPEIALGRDAEKITRLELMDPEGDAPNQKITLEKHGDGWQLTTPLKTTASTPKVQALLANLKGLEVSDAIDSGTGYYERYGLADDKAFHVIAWQGEDKLRDLYFGKSSARGQLLRVAAMPGVFSIASGTPGSYEGFLYTRPLRSWRETSILDFNEDDAVEVHVTNSHGAFSFSKEVGSWSGTSSLRKSDGTLGPPDRAWRRFDENRLKQLLQAYRSLSADEFGEAKDRAESGVDQAEQTGGVLSIRLKDGAELTIRVGKVAKGPSTWAIKDSRFAIKEGGDGTLYALALWTTDWATGGASTFENRTRPNASASGRTRP